MQQSSWLTPVELFGGDSSYNWLWTKPFPLTCLLYFVLLTGPNLQIAGLHQKKIMTKAERSSLGKNVFIGTRLAITLFQNPRFSLSLSEPFPDEACNVKLVGFQTRAEHFSGEVWIFFRWGLNIFQARPERLSNSICSVKLGVFRRELNIFHMRVEHFSDEVWTFFRRNLMFCKPHIQCQTLAFQTRSEQTMPAHFNSNQYFEFPKLDVSVSRC